MTKQEFELLIDYLKGDDYKPAKHIINDIPYINDDKKLRKMVNGLRKQGHPIISCNRGYKYSTNKIEIINCIIDLRGRANQILQACDGLQDYINGN